MMNRTLRTFCFAVLAILAFASSSCEKMFQKDSEKTITAGDKKAAAGDNEPTWSDATRS